MRLVFLVALVAAMRHETLLQTRNSTVSAGGRRLVWVGADKVGLGNVLAGFPDLYFRALREGATIVVGESHAITRDLVRFFDVGFASESSARERSTCEPSMRASPASTCAKTYLSYKGLGAADVARLFGANATAYCRPGPMLARRPLTRAAASPDEARARGAGTYERYEGFSFRPNRTLPCGLQYGLRALIRGPGAGLARALPELEALWDGDASRLAGLVSRAPGEFVYAVAVHVRTLLPHFERTHFHRCSRGGRCGGLRENETAAETRRWLDRPAVRGRWREIADDVENLCGGRAPCPVFVASELALVRADLAAVLRGRAALDVDFLRAPSVGHVEAAGRRLAVDPGATAAERASPYLDWYALANARDIVVRRGHDNLEPKASTYSTTARAWGLDIDRSLRRGVPPCDGLV